MLISQEEHDVLNRLLKKYSVLSKFTEHSKCCTIIGANNSIRDFCAGDYIDSCGRTIVRINRPYSQNLRTNYGSKTDLIIGSKFSHHLSSGFPDRILIEHDDILKLSKFHNFGDKKHITTGLVAILLCMKVFKDVEIFGFGYDNEYNEKCYRSIHDNWNNTSHSINDEHKFISKLISSCEYIHRLEESGKIKRNEYESGETRRFFIWSNENPHKDSTIYIKYLEKFFIPDDSLNIFINTCVPIQLCRSVFLKTTNISLHRRCDKVNSKSLFFGFNQLREIKPIIKNSFVVERDGTVRDITNLSLTDEEKSSSYVDYAPTFRIDMLKFDEIYPERRCMFSTGFLAYHFVNQFYKTSNITLCNFGIVNDDFNRTNKIHGLDFEINYFTENGI